MEAIVYRIRVESVLDGGADAAWAVVTDVDRWAEWDPHERAARIDGPFAAGTTGWSKPRGGPAATWTITAVEPGRSWSTACALPGGGLTGTTTVEPAGPGRFRLVRDVVVTGPLTPLFRVWFGPRMRRDMIRSADALRRRLRDGAPTR